MTSKNLFFILILILASCTRKEKVITPEMAARGGLLFNSVGCTRCHSLSGDNMYGPPLKFNFGGEITVVRKGSLENIELDRNYIIRSMKDPDFEKLPGYRERKMAKIELPSAEIESIADYLIFINTIRK